MIDYDIINVLLLSGVIILLSIIASNSDKYCRFCLRKYKTGEDVFNT
jgi:hypothetical protein